MPKKYIVRQFSPGKENHNKVNPLINLSSLGISNQSSIIKTSLSLGSSETADYGMEDQYYPYGDELYGSQFNKFKDITKNTSQSYAFFDKVYSNRRDYLRQFAQSNEINFVLDTVTNESIVTDENGFFAHLDIDRLKLSINKNYVEGQNKDADTLIRDCKNAFNTIFACYGFDKNNDAWNYYKRFLIEGYLAFEILYDNLEHPKTIIGFKDVDVVTLEPEIEYYNGKEFLVWYQFKGDATRQHIIPDANLIYISWTSMNFAKSTRVSYLEGLTRSFNMLRQLENAHLIWNIQNSQKRIKITVPVGAMTDAKARQRVSEIIADYNEEVSIDDASGEMVVNGEPKFSFAKTYVFPQREGNSTNIEEMGVEGYDMNSIETLKYFWRRFIMETQIPANRFMLDVTGAPANQMMGDANVTREENAFARFIHRIQTIYKEILLKPLWIQVCLKHPKLQYSEVLRQSLGIIYNEENLFTLAKKRTIVSEGANTVGTLSSIMNTDQTPYFSIDFLIKEYLGLTDADLELNRKYKQQDIMRKLDAAKEQKELQAANVNGAPAADMQMEGGGFAPMGGPDMGGGFDIGGGSDMGGGPDMGGGSDMGGSDMGGGTSEVPEPPAPEA